MTHHDTDTDAELMIAKLRRGNRAVLVAVGGGAAVSVLFGALAARVGALRPIGVGIWAGLAFAGVYAATHQGARRQFPLLEDAEPWVLGVLDKTRRVRDFCAGTLSVCALWACFLAIQGAPAEVVVGVFPWYAAIAVGFAGAMRRSTPLLRALDPWHEDGPTRAGDSPGDAARSSSDRRRRRRVRSRRDGRQRAMTRQVTQAGAVSMIFRLGNSPYGSGPTRRLDEEEAEESEE